MNNPNTPHIGVKPIASLAPYMRAIPFCRDTASGLELLSVQEGIPSKVVMEEVHMLGLWIRDGLKELEIIGLEGEIPVSLVAALAHMAKTLSAMTEAINDGWMHKREAAR